MTPSHVASSAPARRPPWGLSLAAIAAISLLVSLAPAPGADLLREEAHNAGHVIVFAIVGLLLRPLLSARYSTATAIAATLLSATLLGVLTEAVQAVLGGDSSIGDVLRDLWGAIVGVTASLASRPGAGRQAWSLRILAACGLLLGLLPLAATLLDYHERDSRLPLLLDANLAASLAYARIGSDVREPSDRHVVPIPAPWAKDGTEQALRIQLDRGDWPGLAINEPAPDWRGHRALTLELINPQSDALSLNLRVDDADSGNEESQRHDEDLQVATRSRQIVEIPLDRIASTPSGRRLDLGKVRQVILFHGGPSPGEAFLIVRLRLER